MVVPLLTLDELNELKREGVGSLARVKLFAVGEHKPGGRVWTAGDMRAAVHNFQRFSEGPGAKLVVPVAVGHEDDQAWVSDTGLPAAGTVSRIEFDGHTLWGRIADIPSVFAEAIDNGSYYTVSCEFYDQPPEGLTGEGATLRRVALLGGDIPAVKGLGRLPKVERHAEVRRVTRHPWRRFRVTRATARSGRGSYYTFAEAGGAMDQTTKDTLIAVIKGKFAALSDEFLAALTDEQLQQLATEATATANSANAEPPADRAALVADILAADPAKDQATLDAMSDDELKALWLQLMGGDDVNSETRKAKPPAVTVQQFAEFRRELAGARGEVRRLAAEAAKSRKAAEVHTFAERRAAVRADLKRLAELHAVTPADLDEAGSENEFANLTRLAADPAVHKFGEKSMSRYEARIAYLEARQGTFRHLFSEKLRRGDGSETDAAADAAKKYAERRNKYLAAAQ